MPKLSYFFIFDHRLKKHPKFLKNQIKLEILCALKAIGPIDILALPLHLAQVRGHSKFFLPILQSTPEWATLRISDRAVIGAYGTIHIES
ncbi:uncharacterized protein PGTG_11438 [Puccinia graminis f. sp. tritici CRL 75-36-700-3]|uniref:Uncharacterized protein n=1 Tax=Puccinia graminis f. sp. tritici (strain CRL 75-36-700-3 / race SCCL) TaxID=418459 RepID=E3KLS0_PUCGT|nr:uncharacterized protein PGTG_11438 [Puccinia graminis f. sp. tritici CRL 75-36-700-3]EFP85269.2 hypothetical protein PGTG_11438 [Puccinia graminis f. sp. tritici CRL 75-36-700-3]